MNKKAFIKTKGGADLDRIERSGQCFRWIYVSPGEYIIPAFGKAIHASEKDGGIEIEFLSKGSSEKDIPFWEKYFDAALDYGKIRRMPDSVDTFLTGAVKAGEGIRIIYQEPFETLITFIISQRKSIPAIKTSVERICDAVGRKIPGTDINDFPAPEELYKLSDKEISECGLGYRAPYIHSAADAVFHGDISFEALDKMSDDELIDALISLKGVGVKVANCTALFGFHRLDLFPIDVWIKRALDRYYGGTFPLEKYHPYNGIMQQYIFAARGNDL